MSSPAASSSAGAPALASAAATDPGFDAVESLYRGATGRSGLRSYEPSLRPPEGTRDYGWLFRPDEPATVAAPVRSGEPRLTGTAAALATTTSGLAAAVPCWPPATRAAGRRWPAAALLAAALTCALLLPWAVAAL